MTELQFDTSGHFHVMPGHPLHRFMGVNRLEWSDLSPFTQGYVEAMAISSRHQDAEMFAFRHLAPETLARTMEDCEAYALRLARPLHDDRDVQRRAGAGLWRMRSRRALNPGLAALLPPLTPYLGDDGKVYLREGV